MEVIKIISIGGGRNIKVKEDWGYNRALGNTCMDNSGFGITTIVGAVGHPAT